MRFKDAIERELSKERYTFFPVRKEPEPIIDTPLNDYSKGESQEAYEVKKRSKGWNRFWYTFENYCEKCKWGMLFVALTGLFITLTIASADLYIKAHGNIDPYHAPIH